MGSIVAQTSLKSNLDPADVVALTCLRDEASEQRESLRREIQRINDWSCLDEWEGQGILCLIAHRLGLAELFAYIPTEYQVRIRRIVQRYKWITERQLRETARLVEAFEAARIPLIVLKDLRAYNPIHLRPCYDIDMLVRKCDVEPTTSLLRELGYKTGAAPFRDQIVDRVRGFDRHEAGITLSIDLHWHLLDRYLPRADLFDMDGIFAERTMVDIGGQMTPVLAPHHFLMNACIHAYTHETRFPTRLIAWADIAEAIRVLQTDDIWNRVVDTSITWACQNDVYLPLRVIQDLFHIEIPAHVLARLRPNVNTIGPELSSYGYITFAFKYLDDISKRFSLSEDDSLLSAGRALVPRANAFFHEITDLLAETERSTGSVPRSFGEAGGGILPLPYVPPAGRLEILIEPAALADFRRLLQERGYTYKGKGKGKGYLKLLQRIDGAELGAVRILILDDLFANSTPARRARPLLARGPNITRLLLRLLRKKMAPNELRVYVHACTPIEQALFILSRYQQTGAVDLLALVELADLLGEQTERIPVEEIAIGHRSGEGEAWIGTLLEILNRYFNISLPVGSLNNISGKEHQRGFIEALDRRTNQVEALSKFLVAPAGIRLIHALTSTETWERVARLWDWLRSQSMSATLHDLVFLVRVATGSSRGRRVPPRIYLTPAGHDLTHLVRRHRYTR